MDADQSGMRVVITGASSVLGRAVMNNYHSRNAAIIPISLARSPSPVPSIPFHAIDVRDISAFRSFLVEENGRRKIDWLVSCGREEPEQAAEGQDGKESLDTGVTAELQGLCGELGIGMVYASSDGVLTTNSPPSTEAAQTHSPATPTPQPSSTLSPSRPKPIYLINPSPLAKPGQSPRFRVLALCGYTQNAHILKKKMSALRKACKEVEFVFLEPPLILDKVDFSTGTATLADLNSEASMEEEGRTEETMPRAWFTSEKIYEKKGGNEVGARYLKLDETIQYFHDFLTSQEQPFDGIFGFSQGGCMASLVAALLERPGLHPLWTAHPNLKPLQYAIFAGGLPALDASVQHFYPLSLPTLHIIGRNDVIVTEERSKGLISRCEDNRVEYHDGGHFIPSKANWRHFLSAYIASFTPEGEQGDVDPPGATAPASGTSTPTPHEHRATPNLSRLAISNAESASTLTATTAPSQQSGLPSDGGLLRSHHSHSGQFCRHAQQGTTLRDVVESAISKGFKTYGLSEHCPRYRKQDLYPEEADLTPADLARLFGEYLAEAHSLREEYVGKIDLLVGLETDYISRMDLDGLENLLNAEQPRIQYLVGSVHHVKEIPIDFDQATYERAVTACAEDDSPRTPLCNFLHAYFDAQSELLDRFKPEVIGHFDLCRLYTPDIKLDDEASFPGVWDKVIRNVTQGTSYGALFELNAAAFRKGWSQAYPGREVLDLILAKEGRLCLSDDSHGPAAVGLNFERLQAYVKSAGIAQLWYLYMEEDERHASLSQSGRRTRAKSVRVSPAGEHGPAWTPTTQTSSTVRSTTDGNIAHKQIGGQMQSEEASTELPIPYGAARCHAQGAAQVLVPANKNQAQESQQMAQSVTRLPNQAEEVTRVMYDLTGSSMFTPGTPAGTPGLDSAPRPDMQTPAPNRPNPNPQSQVRAPVVPNTSAQKIAMSTPSTPTTPINARPAHAQQAFQRPNVIRTPAQYTTGQLQTPMTEETRHSLARARDASKFDRQRIMYNPMDAMEKGKAIIKDQQIPQIEPAALTYAQKLSIELTRTIFAKACRVRDHRVENSWGRDGPLWEPDLEERMWHARVVGDSIDPYTNYLCSNEQAKGEEMAQRAARRLRDAYKTNALANAGVDISQAFSSSSLVQEVNEGRLLAVAGGGSMDINEMTGDESGSAAEGPSPLKKAKPFRTLRTAPDNPVGSSGVDTPTKSSEPKAKKSRKDLKKVFNKPGKFLQAQEDRDLRAIVQHDAMNQQLRSETGMHSGLYSWMPAATQMTLNKLDKGKKGAGGGDGEGGQGEDEESLDAGGSARGSPAPVFQAGPPGSSLNKRPRQASDINTRPASKRQRRDKTDDPTIQSRIDPSTFPAVDLKHTLLDTKLALHREIGKGGRDQAHKQKALEQFLVRMAVHAAREEAKPRVVVGDEDGPRFGKLKSRGRGFGAVNVAAE